jgi:hypothetical protein
MPDFNLHAGLAGDRLAHRPRLHGGGQGEDHHEHENDRQGGRDDEENFQSFHAKVPDARIFISGPGENYFCVTGDLPTRVAPE